MERPEGASGACLLRLRSDRSCPVERCASKGDLVSSVCSAEFRWFEAVCIGVVLFFVQKRHVRWGIYL